MLLMRTAILSLCFLSVLCVEVRAQVPASAICTKIEYKTCQDVFGAFQVATAACETYECVVASDCYPTPEVVYQNLTDCEWNQDAHQNAVPTEYSSAGVLADLKDGFVCFEIGRCRQDCHFDLITGKYTVSVR